MGTGNSWVMNGALVALLSSGLAAQEGPNRAAMPLDAIVQGMQKAQAMMRPQASYQVIREYRLSGATDSKADSEVVAEINFRPPSYRDYTIQSSSGSSRGPQLVRRILDHEVRVSSQDGKAESAISSDNYNFSYLGEATLDGRPCYVLGLKPRRVEKDLISGQAWVDKHSFLIRQIEGEVEKTPFLVVKNGPYQGGVYRSRWHLGAEEHGSGRRCANCWLAYADLPHSGLPERARGRHDFLFVACNCQPAFTLILDD